MAKPTELGPASPCLIADDVTVSIRHYVDLLGFDCRYLGPQDDPYFAIVGRDAAQIMVKAIAPDIPPLPNGSRHDWARWDVYIDTPDPDTLAGEFADRGVRFHRPLADIDDDGLRGFEVADPDGYICFFGRPK